MFSTSEIKQIISDEKLCQFINKLKDPNRIDSILRTFLPYISGHNLFSNAYNNKYIRSEVFFNEYIKNRKSYHYYYSFYVNIPHKIINENIDILLPDITNNTNIKFNRKLIELIMSKIYTNEQLVKGFMNNIGKNLKDLKTGIFIIYEYPKYINNFVHGLVNGNSDINIIVDLIYLIDKNRNVNIKKLINARACAYNSNESLSNSNFMNIFRDEINHSIMLKDALLKYYNYEIIDFQFVRDNKDYLLTKRHDYSKFLRNIKCENAIECIELFKSNKDYQYYIINNIFDSDNITDGFLEYIDENFKKINIEEIVSLLLENRILESSRKNIILRRYFDKYGFEMLSLDIDYYVKNSNVKFIPPSEFINNNFINRIIHIGLCEDIDSLISQFKNSNIKVNFNLNHIDLLCNYEIIKLISLNPDKFTFSNSLSSVKKLLEMNISKKYISNLKPCEPGYKRYLKIFRNRKDVKFIEIASQMTSSDWIWIVKQHLDLNED